LERGGDDDVEKGEEEEVPLAFLPMSEKRPGPFMAMAAAAAAAARGRGREWRGGGRRPPIERGKGMEKGEVRGRRQVSPRGVGARRRRGWLISSGQLSWSLHCTFQSVCPLIRFFIFTALF